MNSIKPVFSEIKSWCDDYQKVGIPHWHCNVKGENDGWKSNFMSNCNSSHYDLGAEEYFDRVVGMVLNHDQDLAPIVEHRIVVKNMFFNSGLVSHMSGNYNEASIYFCVESAGTDKAGHIINVLKSVKFKMFFHGHSDLESALNAMKTSLSESAWASLVEFRASKQVH